MKKGLWVVYKVYTLKLSVTKYLSIMRFFRHERVAFKACETVFTYLGTRYYLGTKFRVADATWTEEGWQNLEIEIISGWNLFIGSIQLSKCISFSFKTGK